MGTREVYCAKVAYPIACIIIAILCIICFGAIYFRYAIVAFVWEKP